MSKYDAKHIVLNFNRCINARDLDGLAKLMHENHVFIDSENNIQKGKKQMIGVWKDFFNQFPDYQNHFSQVIANQNQVVITGDSTCSFKPLDGPAIWTALVEDGLIKEWRVYTDTPENRIKLNVKPNTIKKDFVK